MHSVCATVLNKLLLAIIGAYYSNIMEKFKCGILSSIICAVWDAEEVPKQSEKQLLWAWQNTVNTH